MTLARLAEHSSAEPLGLTPARPADVRDALRRLVGDPDFKASERNRRFLSFVVEETLAGRSDRIKSYTVAVDVFGRGESFDPATDPIVRIEATRLRAALTSYYSGPGRNELLQIGIPKGGYVPAFESVAPSDATPAPPLPIHEAADGASGDSSSLPRSRVLAQAPVATAIATIGLAAVVALGLSTNWLSPPIIAGPVVVIEDTVGMTGGEAERAAARGLTQALVTSLSQLTDLRVMADGKRNAEAASSEADRDQVYVLASSVRIDDAQLHAWWSLVKADTGMVIWSDASDRRIGEMSTVSLESEIASEIVNRIRADSIASQ